MSAFTLTKKLHSLSLGLSPIGAIVGVADWRSRYAYGTLREREIS